MSNTEKAYVNNTELQLLAIQRRRMRNMIMRKVGIKQGNIWLEYLADLADSDWEDEEIMEKVIDVFITIGYKRENITPIICLTMFDPKNN